MEPHNSERVEKVKAPLNAKLWEQEFEDEKEEIGAAIQKLNLNITPEEYWKEYQASVEFIDFDSFLATVDRIIEKHRNDGKIFCFYPNIEFSYSENGLIHNSDEFMIRLLHARIRERGISLSVEVIDHERLRDKSVQNIIVVDDAIYSGTQKAAQLRHVPLDKNLEFYVVGAAHKGEKIIEAAFQERKLKSPKHEHIFETSLHIHDIREHLSPSAQEIYKELTKEQIRRTNRDISQPIVEDELERRANSFLDFPIVFSPFKAPDFRSSHQLGSLIPAPVEEGYIDPNHLLDLPSLKRRFTWKDMFHFRRKR